MRSRLAGFVLLAIVCVTVPAASRAEELLKHVPDDAFVVVRFASADKVLGNMKNFLTGVSPVAAQGMEAVESGLQEFTTLTGNGWQAIDRTEPFYIAAFPYFNQRQPVVIFLKANDEEAVRRAAAGAEEDGEVAVQQRDDGFVEVKGRHTAYVTKRGGYIAFTRNKTLLKHMSEANTKMQSFADALGGEALEIVNAGDVSVAVHAAPVVKKHKKEIESARDEVNAVIDDMPDEQLGTATPELTKKFYKTIVRFSFEALHDVRWAVGRVNLGADGASAEGLIGFKQGSATDNFFASNPPSAMSNLQRLPAHDPGYFGFKMDNDAWAWDWLRMNYGENEEQRDAIEKAFKMMKAARLESTLASYAFPKDGQTGFVGTTIEQAENAAKYRKAWGNYIQAIGTMETPLLSQTFKYKKGAESYQGRDIDLLTMNIEIADAEIAAVLEGIYKKVFGGNEFQSRLAVVDQMIVQTTGNDPAAMHRVLDSLESGKGVAGADVEFRKTREQLAKEANFYLIADIPRLILEAVAMLRDVEPFAESFELIPFNFSVQPPASYFGLSIGTEPHALRIKGPLADSAAERLDANLRPVVVVRRARRTA